MSLLHKLEISILVREHSLQFRRSIKDDQDENQNWDNRSDSCTVSLLTIFCIEVYWVTELIKLFQLSAKHL